MKSEDRPEPPQVAGEAATLLGFLEFHRATLQWKCDGLSDAQLRKRAVPPSTMSLLGLVRHMADVERSWFRRRFQGEDVEPRYWSDTNLDGDFDDTEAADVAEAFAAWREEIVHARRIVAASDSLDQTFEHPRDGTMNLRWVLLHMIEEYARHNGHADLLRQQLDGATGE